MADIFYVESGYVDSGYFVYTADAASAVSASATLSVQADRLQGNVINLDSTTSLTSSVDRIRKGSSTLAVTATVSSQADRIRTVNKTLTSQATLQSNAGKDVVASATLSVTANLDANVVTKRGAASLIMSSGTMSVRGNAIFRIASPNTIPGANNVTTGIHSTTSTVSTWNPSGTWNINPGTTISFWARKDLVSDNNGVILNSASFSSPYVSGLTVELKQGSINLRARYYTDDNPLIETTLTWTDVSQDLVVDTEWHHYLFYVEVWTEQSYGREYRVKLWQDGIDLGSQTQFGPDDINTVIKGPFNIGFEKTWNSTTNTFNLTNSNKIFRGCIAQLWLDDDVASNYAISSWYNNGYVNSLPAGPRYTTTFNYPYDASTAFYRVSGTTLTQSSLTYEWLCNQENVKFLDTVSSVNFLGGILRGARSTLSAQASITKAIGDTNVSGEATLQAITQLAVEARRLPGTGAVLDTRATLVVRPNFIEQSSAHLSASASLTTSPTYAIFGSATLPVTSSARTVTSAEATLASQFTIEQYGDKVVGGTAHLDSHFEVPTAIGGVNIIARANNIHSEFTLSAKLTVVPKQDDLMTVFVPQDSRGLRVLPETRFATVEIESNLNRVLMETKEITVSYESRQIREAVNPALETTPLRIRRIPA